MNFALLAANGVSGLANGLAQGANQMYQWQQMFDFQSKNQGFMMKYLMQQQQNYQDNLILRAQLQGINVPASLMRAGVSSSSLNSNSIGSTSDLNQNPEPREHPQVNQPDQASTTPLVNQNEFPAMGPYNPSVAGDLANSEGSEESSTNHTLKDDLRLDNFHHDNISLSQSDDIPYFDEPTTSTGEPRKTNFPGGDIPMKPLKPPPSFKSGRVNQPNSAPTGDYILSRQFTNSGRTPQPLVRQSEPEESDDRKPLLSETEL